MIHVLDLHFSGEPLTIASFLIDTTEGPVLVETGPHSTFPQLKAALVGHDVAIEDIRHVFLTHIHLDHAGAAWAFAQHGARIYMHPAGAPHMIDPTKLLQSAKRIYQDEMDRLWGDLQPIPQENIEIVEDGAHIQIGDTMLHAWHTPGHASHHIAWQVEKAIITGDVAGIKINNGPVMPPCPPPDINIEDWQASIQKLKDLDCNTFYLTHYGKVEDTKHHLEALENRLLQWANWIHPYWKNRVDMAKVVPQFEEYVNWQLTETGITLQEKKQYANANPPWMSVAGLLRYWRKKAEL